MLQLQLLYFDGVTNDNAHSNAHSMNIITVGHLGCSLAESLAQT